MAAMSCYYLHHYFMPDFNHKRLRPVAMVDGNIDAHYLGYVQNVVAGQVLAELVTMEELPEGAAPHSVAAASPSAPAFAPLPDLRDGYPEPEEPPPARPRDASGYKDFLSKMESVDTRFLYDAPVFPLGPNCARDPQNPNRIISLVNGYCFYHQGFITVKKLLNVRQDVSFHTGNITYVGDVVVHGSVFPGFSLCGRNIRVKDRIDGGTVRAKGDVVAEGGIKGSPKALLEAGGTVRLAFCEQATIVTAGNLVIDGACMHSKLYVGGSLLVKGRLQGGSVNCGGTVVVEEQLGGGQGAPTRIALGCDPIAHLHQLWLNECHEEQSNRLQYYTARARKGPHMEEEYAPLVELATQKLTVVQDMRRAFAVETVADSQNRLVVRGVVYPGVVISIGRAYRNIVDEVSDVFFSLREDEIVNGFPAISKGFPPVGGATGLPDENA
jgi:uncharacterized protein (DUF342 family)